jgi:hypothetical protein
VTCMIDEDEELAHEWLLGTPGPKGIREYLKTGSERELKARAAMARILRSEAPGGFFTGLMAALVDPPRRGVIIPNVANRKIAFKRPRGTPVVVSDRRRVEIAAFMHEQLAAQKRKPAATAAQARNLKDVVAAAQAKFAISHGTVMDIWREFKPKPKSK